ncbi:MAG: T9SS type A sorting domain-containing protein [Bacteroidales bacterium]|nr:T9SS type A sorting domain-containing protein [Bacteroidales bacterium]
MKNILLHIKVALLGFLLIAPFALLASESGKKPNLSMTIESQGSNVMEDSSETSFNIASYKDTENTNIPQIQFSNPFPNPASSFVKINYRFPSINDFGEVKIMDLTGKTVKTYPIEGSNNSLQINVSDLTHGLYFCTVYYKGQMIKSNKLIVSNQ